MCVDKRVLDWKPMLLHLFFLSTFVAIQRCCLLDLGIIIEISQTTVWVGQDKLIETIFAITNPDLDGNRTSVAAFCFNSSVLYRFNDTQSWNRSLAVATIKNYSEKLSSDEAVNDCDEKLLPLAASVIFSDKMVLLYITDANSTKVLSENRDANIDFFRKKNITFSVFEVGTDGKKTSQVKVTWVKEKDYQLVETLESVSKNLNSILSRVCS